MTTLPGWMRRLGSLCLSLGLAGIAHLAHAAGPLELTEQERAWITANPVVAVGVRSDLRPFEFVEDGKVKGLAGEYLRSVARLTGLKFVIKQAKDNMLSESGWLQDGTVDLYPMAIRNIGPLSDARGILFTLPYYLNTTVIISPDGASFMDELAELDGKTVAMSQYNPIERVLREKVPNIRILYGDSAQNTLDLVASGKADAAVGLDGFYRPYVTSRYEGTLQICGVISSATAELSMAVSARQPMLYAIVQKALQSITADEAHKMNQGWLTDAQFGSPSLKVLVRYFTTHGLLLGTTLLLLALLAYSSRRAHRRAVRSEREKAMFLAVMSHEIRSPMNAVLASVELLQRTPLNEAQQRLTTLSYDGSNTLLRLVNDVLDMSKLESGKFTLDCQPTDISALIAEMIDLYLPQAQAKGLGLSATVADCGRLMLDPIRMRQILHNLLSNAIKFTPEGTVSVTVGLLPGKTSAVDGILEIAVADTGIGIADEAQGALFQPYSQVSESARKGVRGTGLGLLICRGLVTHMHGDITLRSTLGIGTTVTLSLPVTKATDEAPAATRQQEAPKLQPGGPRLSILLVEDTPANQYVIKEQLSSLGCDTHLASDGLQAWQAFLNASYDLVLMDCDLPDKDGYQLTREFRAHEIEHGLAPCPIIAISATSGSEHTFRCLDAGMDGVISKPIGLAKLQDTIETWCVTTLIEQDGEYPCDMAQAPSIASDFVRESLLEDLRALHAAVKKRDARETRHFAHRLRGASITLGLLPMEQYCADLETLASAQDNMDIDEANRLLEALTQAFNRQVSSSMMLDG